MSVIRAVATGVIFLMIAVLPIYAVICLFAAAFGLYRHRDSCCRPLARCGKLLLPLAAAAAGGAVFLADGRFISSGLERQTVPSAAAGLTLLTVNIAILAGMHFAVMWAMSCTPPRPRKVRAQAPIAARSHY